MTSSGSLHVLDVTAADARASYRCRTLNSLSAAAQLSSAAHIKLEDAAGSFPPRSPAHNPDSVLVAEVGSSATLPCHAPGQPPPVHSWSKDLLPIPAREDHVRAWLVGGALVLTSLVPSGSGRYRCVVNNTAGTTTLITRLTVTSPLVVQVVPPTRQLTRGGALELICRVSGGPVRALTWYKDGRQLRPGGRLVEESSQTGAMSGGPGVVVSVLRAPVAEGADAGVYQCRSTSEYDAAHAHSTVTMAASAPLLLYRFIAHTLQPGPAVSLKCIGRATPTPHITWTLDGFPLPQTRRLLMGQFVSPHGDVISHVNISSVRVSDGGLYQCSAQNTAGSASHSARLNVYGPPTIRQMGQLTAVAGETFSVTCPVGGHPIDKITWTKDGTELPLSHNQLTHPNGTLTLSSVTRAGDEGNYACTARDKQGRMDTQALLLQVRVPPRLAPLVFVGSGRAGERLQATCLVVAGDSPLLLNWLRNDQPLSHEQLKGILITRNSEFASTLAVEHAAAEHSGRYSCAASNGAAAVTASATLTVNVPPSWHLEPSDSSVDFGKSLKLHCSAEGFPVPKVIWKKQTLSGSWGDITPDRNVLSGGDGQPSPDRTASDDARDRTGKATSSRASPSGLEFSSSLLVVARATREHGGRYLCRATNDVGPGLSKMVTITVHEPPWFPFEPRTTEGQVGRRVTLRCRVRGDSPLTITWHKDGRSLSELPRYVIQTFNEPPDTTTLELLIPTALASDSGQYKCRANNAHGTNTQLHDMLVEDVPGPPRQVQVAEEGSRFIVLNWLPPTTPAEGAGTITGYRVLYASDRGAKEEMSASGVVARVEGLLPATRYSFRMSAENRVGRSEPSGAVIATTREEAPSGAPRNVKVVRTTSTSLTLFWEPPPDNTTHGTLRGYCLGVKDNSFAEHSESSGYFYINIRMQKSAGGQVNSTEGRLLETNLRHVVCQMSSESFHDHRMPSNGNHSSRSIKKDSFQTSSINLENITRTVDYRFISPVESGGSRKSLEALGRQVGHNASDQKDIHGTIQVEADLVHSASSGLKMVVKGLRPHTRYALHLRAFNSQGTGPASITATATTAEDKPSSSPEDVSCGAVTPTELIVKWALPPLRATNGRITGYRVTWGKLFTSDGWEQHSIGLTRQAREATPSLTQNSHQYLLPHSAFKFVRRKRSSASTYSVEINEQASSLLPSTGAGLPPPSGGRAVLVVQGRSARLLNLSPFTNYTVTVAAATAVGVGVASAPLTCSTLEDVPSAPAGVKAVSSGPESVVVAWRAPLHPNGRVTGYMVHWTQQGGEQRAQAPSTSRHWQLLGLRTNHSCQVWVHAHTKAGIGAPSSKLSVTPTEAVAAGVWSVGGRVSVAWKQDVQLRCDAVGEPLLTRGWLFNGEPVSEKDSRVSVSPEGALRLLDAQRTFTGNYTCIASNRHGGDSVMHHLLVIMPPSPPRLHVIETTPSSVRLQWTVDDDGGAAVTKVTLYYRSPGASTLQEYMAENSHEVCNLSCGTLYHFFSTATNAAGSSESSAVSEARTKGRAPEAPPQFQFITSNSSQATLYLTQWESGGCPITHFKVQYRILRGTDWTTVSSEVPVVRTFAVSGLEPGQQYELRVTAYNAAGATPALYAATTSGLQGVENNGLVEGPDGFWTDVGSRGLTDAEGATWSGSRVLLPLILSTTALVLTAFAGCYCFAKRRIVSAACSHSSGCKKEQLPQDTSGGDEERETSLSRSPKLVIAAQPNTESLLHYPSEEYQLQPLRAYPTRLAGSSSTTQRSPFPFAQYRETALVDHPGPNERVRKEQEVSFGELRSASNIPSESFDQPLYLNGNTSHKLNRSQKHYLLQKQQLMRTEQETPRERYEDISYPQEHLNTYSRNNHRPKRSPAYS